MACKGFFIYGVHNRGHFVLIVYSVSIWVAILSAFSSNETFI